MLSVSKRLRPLPSDTKSLLDESKSPSYLFTEENVLIFHGSYHFHLEIQVMVELGTGYFTEKNIPDSKELIDRKVSTR